LEHSSRYIVLFAAAVCAVCAVFVASSAELLRERQERNKLIDVQQKVLTLAGMMEEGQKLTGDEVEALYAANIKPLVIDLESGRYAPEVDPASFDQREASSDPDTSRVAPENSAKVRRLPTNAVVYQVQPEGQPVQAIILPIQGQGLWSTLYGFISLADDANTIEGITFYEHGETPGLGGEVDNPRWKALWKGRKAFGEKGDVAIKVNKGAAGPAAEDPYHVDGLSGATITSRGVSNTLDFWLGENGFGDYLALFRQERGI
jgi:Na+-transporting NADH:ubiquinone oxidoreductase subunit C